MLKCVSKLQPSPGRLAHQSRDKVTAVGRHRIDQLLHRTGPTRMQFEHSEQPSSGIRISQRSIAYILRRRRRDSRRVGDLAQRRIRACADLMLCPQTAVRRVARPDPAVAAEPRRPLDFCRARSAPDSGHRAGGQASHLANPAVGPVWLAAKYALRRRLAIGQRQWHSMGDVRPDGGYERFVGVAVEELDLYALVAPQLCRAQTMHPVDDSHGLSVHDNRRQVDALFGQHCDVIKALAVEAGRIRRFQRRARNYLYAWLNQCSLGSLAAVWCSIGGSEVVRHAGLSARADWSRLPFHFPHLTPSGPITSYAWRSGLLAGRCR